MHEPGEVKPYSASERMQLTEIASSVNDRRSKILCHTFLVVVFVFCGFHGQEGFGSVDADVNYVAMILHTLHTSTQDLSCHKIIK